MVSFCSPVTMRKMMDEMMDSTKQRASATSSVPTVNQLLQRGMQRGLLLLLLSTKNPSAHLNSLWSPGALEVFTQLRPDAFLSFRPSNNFDSNTSYNIIQGLIQEWVGVGMKSSSIQHLPLICAQYHNCMRWYCDC